MKIKYDYDKENNIFSVNWGKAEESVEVKTKEGEDIVFDYDKKGRIVGIEIFDWDKR